jgi:hypothetical protein
MGLISPELLSLTMRRAAPLDFQELAKPALWRDSHSLSNSKGRPESEDSAISSVIHKSFRIPITHPILSLISFSRIFGGGLIEEDEWRRYG